MIVEVLIAREPTLGLHKEKQSHQNLAMVKPNGTKHKVLGERVSHGTLMLEVIMRLLTLTSRVRPI